MAQKRAFLGRLLQAVLPFILQEVGRYYIEDKTKPSGLGRTLVAVSGVVETVKDSNPKEEIKASLGGVRTAITEYVKTLK